MEQPVPELRDKTYNGAVNCGVASAIVRRANRNRIGLTITNDSDTVIYLAYGDVAVLNSGIRLNAAGGAKEINFTNLYRGTISAITTAADKILTFIEEE